MLVEHLWHQINQIRKKILAITYNLLAISQNLQIYIFFLFPSFLINKFVNSSLFCKFKSKNNRLWNLTRISFLFQGLYFDHKCLALFLVKDQASSWNTQLVCRIDEYNKIQIPFKNFVWWLNFVTLTPHTIWKNLDQIKTMKFDFLECK